MATTNTTLERSFPFSFPEACEVQHYVQALHFNPVLQGMNL